MTNERYYILKLHSEQPVPQDVLVEHIAVALRAFQEVKVTVLPQVTTVEPVDPPIPTPRVHPFDGPEVFDDYGLDDPYPTLTRALDSLAAARRP